MGKSADSQTTRIEPPAFVRPFLEDAAGEAQGLYGQGPQSFFPGQTYADFTPLQTESLGAQENFARQMLPMLNEQLFGSFGQALNTDVTQDPAVQAALGSIESRGNQNFLENILPGLRRGATGAGQEFGTRGELAAGVAGSRIGRDIADAQGTFLGGQLDSARRAQGAAMALAPQIAQQGLLPASILGQVGGAQQAQEQLGINEAMNRFNFGQMAPENALNTYINQLTGLQGNMNTESTALGGGTNPAIGGAIGGGLLGNALGSSVVAGPLHSFGPFSTLGPYGLVGGALLGALLS